MANDFKILEVYHAGTDIIERPDCKFGRENLDFGRGFYVTDIYDQALNFAKAKGLERQLPAKINVYHLEIEKLLQQSKSLIFNRYNDEWLEFIVACRAGKDNWRCYDYVEGGVADDRVIDTVNMYIQGYMSKERALKKLRYLKPNNQMCLLKQKLVDEFLHFNQCITLSEDGLL